MVRPIELVLVGAGNIGIRHLQGLGRSRNAIRVYVVDNRSERLAVATGEGANLPNLEVFPVERWSQLPRAVDIAIVATSARERARALEDLLGHARVRYVIVEKVAFQSSSAFDASMERLEAGGVQAWVNCPRRIWPFYRALREALHVDRRLGLQLRGRHFGLACNAVHIIDTLQFLTSDEDVALAEAALERVVPSKRDGYYECFGRLTFLGASGARIDIVCEADGPETLEMAWTGDARPIVVCEARGQFGDPASGVAFDVGRPPYQSEMTGRIVDDLVERGNCGLASMSESRKAHTILFEALGPFFAANGFDVSQGIPIT